MMARNYLGGAHGRGDVVTNFPAGAALRNVAPTGGDFVAIVQPDGKLRDASGNVILVPSGAYFAFAWRRPGLPAVWNDGPAAERQAIEIYQGGTRAPMMTVTRRDGVDGDPDFNPLGLAGQTSGVRQYEIQIPRVTDGSDLYFLARSDGSASNVLKKFDGGIDLNSQMSFGPVTGAKRDFAPGRNDDQRDDQGDGDMSNDSVRQFSNETYLGYEQMRFVGRWNEKFAASDISRNVTGSLGAETWTATLGTAGVTANLGNGPNSGHETATWLYHEPTSDNQLGTGDLQFQPAPENAGGVPITIWLKAGYQNEIERAYLYYTTDGVTAPEGSGGVGKGLTQVLALTDTAAGTIDGGTQQSRWWSGTLPVLATGTVLTYKIGGHREVVSNRFPFTEGDHAEIERMETVFEVADFDATAVAFHPHNDYGEMMTGLEEGYHILRTRPFIGRGDGSSIYQTHTQTFYYDSSRPSGTIAFPNEADQLGGSSYEFVVLTDASVQEVRFNVGDSDAGNDGAGNGSWASATLQGPTEYLRDSGADKEWRFEYLNIPSSGAAVVQVRLMEDSSSQDMSLSDADGWFTTLSRNVVTGSGRTWSIAQPVARGVVSLTFPTGVTALIEGPARLEVRGANALHMAKGRGFFHVPEGAEGFVCTTESLFVEDLGTEFGIVAGAVEEVHVLKGQVRLKPHDGNDALKTLDAGESLAWRDSALELSIPSRDFASSFSGRVTIFADDFDEPDGTSLDGKRPDIGDAPWKVTQGSQIIQNNIIDTSGAFRKAAFVAIPTALDEMAHVLLLTIEAESSQSAMHTAGWAGVSLYTGEQERIFVGDPNGPGLSWGLHPAGWQVQNDCPGLTGKSIVTLRYDYRTGLTELFAGATTTGDALASEWIAPGLVFDRLRIANGSQLDAALDAGLDSEVVNEVEEVDVRSDIAIRSLRLDVLRAES